ncbi:MAG: hypothetical protein R2851_05120 [Caldilineaceae bacterium]
MQHFTEIDDLTGCAFLVSDSAQLITGQAIAADGGVLVSSAMIGRDMTPPISWTQYRAAQEPLLPADNLTWPFAGYGLAGVGVDGAPVVAPMPT